jgi:hypothetical protein
MSEAVPEAPTPQALQIQRRFSASRDDLNRYFTDASHLAAGSRNGSRFLI